MTITDSTSGPRCAGVASAESLLAAGVSHDFTILTLCEEIGLSAAEAQRAWDAARARTAPHHPLSSGCVEGR